MGILPVPTGRTSELMVQQRMLWQLGDSQSALLRLQTQISSGQRLSLPSEDAPAALRALGLQQLLNRKDQIKTNLATSQSFLAATDSALSQVSGLLIGIRGTAQGVVGATATDAQRSAAADQVAQALQQLVNTANQQFRGRYLFAGSRGDAVPFSVNGTAVQYSGNQNALSSFADTGLLLQTNSDGHSVFGAFSDVAQSTADLSPGLNDNTQLASLRAGKGVSKTSIAISDGVSTSVVDLSKAQTIGDVISLIEHNPPAGRTVTVTATATGLNLALDAVGGGSLTIRETANGTTASELGILTEAGQGTGPVVGKDLDPRLTSTTSLANLLGARARATISSPGSSNDIVIEAKANGAALNGVQVSFVNNDSLTQGQETITYDANAKTLVFQINAAHTTAQDVVNALNNDPTAGSLFQGQLSAHDTGDPTDSHSMLLNVNVSGTTSGGIGTQFDQQSGLKITSGNQTYLVDLSQAKNVQDMLNKINNSGAGVLAEINESGTGINIVSRSSGVDFSIGENGGSTATQLGVRTFTQATRLEDLNHGIGVHTLNGMAPDFTIRRKDGVELKFDVSAAKTIGDVIDLINNDPANQDPAHAVTARLAVNGNGIELSTSDTSTTASFAVLQKAGSQAAQDLGLIPIGATSSSTAASSGGTDTIAGRDVNPGEVNGVFNALVRLEQALRSNDDVALQRAMAQLDDGTARVNVARADLGARQQGLDTLSHGLDTEVTTLKSSLSNEIDTDLPQAVTDLAGRQAAFQAALQTAAAISHLSLLDFL